LGGRWKTRKGLRQLFGVVSRLGRIDTLDRQVKEDDAERLTILH